MSKESGRWWECDSKGSVFADGEEPPGVRSKKKPRSLPVDTSDVKGGVETRWMD